MCVYDSLLVKAAWGLLKLVCFVLASFVFSFVFWSTKKWLDAGECCKKKKK